jgi:hypothetical protein
MDYLNLGNEEKKYEELKILQEQKVIENEMRKIVGG